MSRACFLLCVRNMEHRPERIPLISLGVLCLSLATACDTATSAADLRANKAADGQPNVDGGASGVTCAYQGHTYKPGDTFPPDCNNCDCDANGQVDCKQRACVELCPAAAPAVGSPCTKPDHVCPYDTGNCITSHRYQCKGGKWTEIVNSSCGAVQGCPSITDEAKCAQTSPCRWWKTPDGASCLDNCAALGEAACKQLSLCRWENLSDTAFPCVSASCPALTCDDVSCRHGRHQENRCNTCKCAVCTGIEIRDCANGVTSYRCCPVGAPCATEMDDGTCGT